MTQAVSTKGMHHVADVNRTIGGSVTTVLRSAIISGDLQPGARLGQHDLQATFGVSQAPVRDALRKLEAEGLVEHRPNRGVFVLGMDSEELLNVVAPTRLLLEQYAIHRALASRRVELLEALEAIFVKMEATAVAGDLRQLHDLDIQFHEVAINLADQPHTLQLWRSVVLRLRAAFTRLGAADTPADIVLEHRQLLEAIRSGKKKQIESVLYEHAIGRTMLLVDQSSSMQT